MVELTITMKDDEKRRLSRTFLVYEEFVMTDLDPLILGYIEEVKKEFKGVPTDVKVKTLMVVS
jgi:hypothetical protein